MRRRSSTRVRERRRKKWVVWWWYGDQFIADLVVLQEAENGKSKRQKGSENHKSERKNTAVYVTSLPPDATVEEVNEVFSKCGVIAEEIDSGRPRIKLYTDDQGNVKGDALIVYFRPESVQLAIQMLDDMDFRFGEVGPRGKIRVKEADFSYKKQKEAPTEKFSQDKKKIIRRTQKMNEWVLYDGS
jgi:HIV Tat-specific factor 1